MEAIRVLMADNEEVFREGWVRLLRNQPPIEVVCQCAQGKETVHKIRETKPDVVILSADLPDVDCLEIVRKVAESSPAVKVAVITRVGQEPGPLQIIQAGAKACVDRKPLADALVRCVEMVSDGRITIGHRFRDFFTETVSIVDDCVRSIEMIASGRIIIGNTVVQEFLDEIARADENDSPKGGIRMSALSEREREIARLIAEGSTNKEIANRLSIAEETVKGHVKTALKKLDMRNRQQLAVYAVLQHWVTATHTRDPRIPG